MVIQDYKKHAYIFRIQEIERSMNMKSRSSNRQPFNCKACNETFRFKLDLDIHKKTHSGGKVYSCIVCDKLFLCQAFLTTHERIHTGEKPYCCVHCGKTFAQKSNLTTHQRTICKKKPPVGRRRRGKKLDTGNKGPR